MSNNQQRGPPPFDDDKNSNLIIRSKDGYNFYVQREKVADASQVLQRLLSLPHPSVDNAGPSDYVGSSPVMETQEVNSAVNQLLRCCYGLDCVPDNVNGITDLLKLADKYELESATRAAIDALPLLSKEKPFATYAIACSLKMKGIAAHIGETTLRRSTFASEMETLHNSENYTGLRMLNGLELAMGALWDYERRCWEAVEPLVDVQWWINEDRICNQRERLPMWSKKSTICCPETLVKVSIECEPRDELRTKEYYVKKWFLAYLAEVSVTVRKGPVLQQLTSTMPLLKAAVVANNCPKCRPIVNESFSTFVDELKMRAEQEIHGVDFRLNL